jgi:prevent-host-death family protein
MPKRNSQKGIKYPRYIGAGEFKSKCLGLMDEVSERKEEIIITKHGQPLVKLVPFEKEIPDLAGYLKGSLEIRGNIIHSPAVRWNADA